MESVHNPDRFMSDLRHILSQGRKRLGLLIGAGAPFGIRVTPEGKIAPDGNPLIPNVDGLTKKVISELSGSHAKVMSELIKELGADSNIEKILSRVRLLHQALGAAKVHEYDSKAYHELGEAICKSIGTTVGAKLPLERCAYNEIVSWVSGTQRPFPIEIFTTNYDLLFEEAFELARAPYFDGFTGGHAPFFDPVSVAGNDLPARWSRLWKLHGSLGWAIENKNVVRGRGREATQLVYPDHLKYDLTQKQPYSALFERLKEFLLTPDTLLLTSGFSFRDSHVCAVFDEALAMNANAAVFAFQYQNLADEMEARRMAFEHPNLSAYAADGAVINAVEGKWRPGELPKNWGEIRASFWGNRAEGGPQVFLLGDYVAFSRFCALSQATEISRVLPETVVEDQPATQPAR